MVFNSIEFAIFFTVVYFLYWCGGLRWQKLLLIVAGYFFYGFWDIRFLCLITFSAILDYLMGRMIATGRIELQERIKASLCLCGMVMLCTIPNWSAVTILHSGHLNPVIDWLRFWELDWISLTATPITLGIVVLANVSYRYIRRLPTQSRRRTMITTSVIANLAFLGIFKYCNFFLDSAKTFLDGIGFPISRLELQIVLPVGISFYTFQSLSYTIDVYRKQFRPVRKLFDFLLFVAYFPPMVAGPIERARDLIPQLLKPRVWSLDRTSWGIFLILIGLFKKVAIADGLAGAVNSVYDASGAVSTMDVYLATLFFAVQIYCDFSGYSDIAIGVSALLGIDLMMNFNVPYSSCNPSEFWRRWHISLSSWLRDYLYIPLGGNRKGNLRTDFNLMTTMVLGGLWHGAAWNFILWGAYHGLLLIIHRRWCRLFDARWPQDKNGVPRIGNPWLTPIRMTVFFVFTCYGWMLFRAVSVDQVGRFTASLFGWSFGTVDVMRRPTLSAIAGLLLLVFMDVWQVFDGSPRFVSRWPSICVGILYGILIFLIAMGASNEPVQFIYFQF